MEQLSDCVEQTPNRNNAIAELLNRDVIPVLPCEYDLIKETCELFNEKLFQIIDYPEGDYPTITIGSQVIIEHTDEDRTVHINSIYMSGHLDNINDLVSTRITSPIAQLLLGKSEGDIIIIEPTTMLSLDGINNILGIDIIKVTNETIAKLNQHSLYLTKSGIL